MPKITYIPQTRNIFSSAPITSVARRRVAGYARVSTDSDEQFTSYEAQVDYYTNYIQANPRWEFAGVYTDEGITGTNTKRRDGFNQMVADAMDGKIDLIVTKSVSRFARNTVDSLTTIRKLKDKGVEVFFEKESIWTFDSKGELLLTIMSSLAQEESRSISENVTWSIRKRFADGRVSVGYSSFLGYDKGPDGSMVINPEEAKTVVLIYKMFLSGKTPGAIAAHLTESGIPTPGGKKQWRSTTIISILTNEKYKGDALLQKRFTIDFLSKKTKLNTGEIPQYYIEGSHEAIIAPDEFDMVQAEMARRKQYGRSYSTTSLFASRIICGECGSFYGHKVWHSTDEKYRRNVWRCNGMFKGAKRCPTPVLDEDIIRQMFIMAYSQLASRREEVAADVHDILSLLSDCTAIDRQIAVQNEKLDEINTLLRAEIQNNAATAIAPDEFDAKFKKLQERYMTIEKKLAELKAQKTERNNRRTLIKGFLTQLVNSPTDKWDDRIWISTLEIATANSDGSVDFKFYNGQSIHVDAIKKKRKKRGD